jgi:hypothetical protein
MIFFFKIISPLLLLTFSLPSLPTFFPTPTNFTSPPPLFNLFSSLPFCLSPSFFFFPFFPYFSPCSSYLSHSLFPCYLFFFFKLFFNVLLFSSVCYKLGTMVVCMCFQMLLKSWSGGCKCVWAFKCC